MEHVVRPHDGFLRQLIFGHVQVLVIDGASMIQEQKVDLSKLPRQDPIVGGPNSDLHFALDAGPLVDGSGDVGNRSINVTTRDAALPTELPYPTGHHHRGVPDVAAHLHDAVAVPERFLQQNSLLVTLNLQPFPLRCERLERRQHRVDVAPLGAGLHKLQDADLLLTHVGDGEDRDRVPHLRSVQHDHALREDFLRLLSHAMVGHLLRELVRDLRLPSRLAR
mmetsp:Transcript_47858/g.137291  ORF Transcript_47858/g.137291 Transcript_47858/m.137291 type:complete len:222 (+) Transcript_47858:446-1111(+)